MTALCLTAALADPAAAGKPVPFKGSIQTVEIIDLSGLPTTITSDAIGTGIATHLGQFTASWFVVIDVTNVPIVGIGVGVYTAANGDSFFVDTVGEGSPTDDPDVISILDMLTITGGTGRFAGATGSFIRKALLNQVTGFTSGSFEGTISY
jgi:hypothetical protein